MSRPRLVLASASLGFLLLVMLMAIDLGPDRARPWLMISSGVALIAAVQSVASDPRDLTLALVLCMPSVLALLAEGSPTWLIGPLGALLLLAGELNALSWDCHGVAELNPVTRRRLSRAGWLSGFALVAAVGVAFVAGAA
jgi:hypothetical protein